jgi:hypothetical protein
LGNISTVNLDKLSQLHHGSINRQASEMQIKYLLLNGAIARNTTQNTLHMQQILKWGENRPKLTKMAETRPESNNN